MRRLADLILVFITIVALALFAGSIRAVDTADREIDRLQNLLWEEQAKTDAARTEAIRWRGIAARLGASASPAPTLSR